MGRRELFKEYGLRRGKFILENMPVPQHNETIEEAYYEIEQNARQYDDFTFIANELNTSDCPEEAWEAYEAGLWEALEEHQLKLSKVF